jgi:hypothetical protein
MAMVRHMVMRLTVPRSHRRLPRQHLLLLSK